MAEVTIFKGLFRYLCFVKLEWNLAYEMFNTQNIGSKIKYTFIFS